jgi:disulfide bond formation protein DsbB
MCLWQRWPHLAAAIVGILGGGAVAAGLLGRGLARPLAILTALLVGVSGAIAVYHAGVEWHWWPGPSQCTGSAFKLSGTLDLNAPVVMCDRAAWRLFGLSLAGYNAIISLGAAAIGLVLLARARRAR